MVGTAVTLIELMLPVKGKSRLQIRESEAVKTVVVSITRRSLVQIQPPQLRIDKIALKCYLVFSIQKWNLHREILARIYIEILEKKRSCSIMQKITKETTIAKTIMMKGEKAGSIIDKVLCDGEKSCCPGTTLTLQTAAYLKHKEAYLPKLLQELNELPKTERGDNNG